MSDIERSGSRSASPRRPRTADGGLRDSRSHSRSRKSRERKDSHREAKYSRSRSRSVSRGRKSYRGSKYANVGHRGSSRSRSRSPYRSGRYSRSRSRSYSRSRYSRERHVYRSHSRSPMSSRRRHVGNRDNPCPSRCLGVFGLSIFTTEQQIHHIFSKYGPVERVQVVIDAKTGRSRGFCFVYFESSEDSKVAKEQCTGMAIDGRRIRVDFSITQRAHTPTPGIYMGKPTHLHDRGWDGPRRREISYRGSYRRSPSPYYSRRRSRYDRSRSRSYSPHQKNAMRSAKTHKTRRKLQQPPSSFADCPEEPTEEDVGKDFSTLVNAPLSKGGHFIFKSEKAWSIDLSQYSEFFTLNVNTLSAAINCIPFNEYVDVDDRYFTSDQLTSICNNAEEAKAAYNTVLDEPNTSSLANDAGEDATSGQSRILQPATKPRPEDSIDNLEEDIDFLLSLKEPVQSSAATITQPISVPHASDSKPKITPNKPIDLEKWLDSVLDDFPDTRR